jgi:hypothetical protein
VGADHLRISRTNRHGWRLPARSLLHAMCSAFLLMVSAAGSPAKELKCENVTISFEHQEDILAEDVCGGVASANRFFLGCGFKPLASLKITVDREVEKVTGYPVFGVFIVATNTILILDAAGFRKSIEALPVSAVVPWRRWYRSIIAHEMAHAILRANLSEELPWLYHEYIAGVVQMASLPAEDQAVLLRAFPKFSARDGAAMLNEFIYAFAPVGFVIGAFANARRFPDRCAHIREVIRRKAIPTVVNGAK